MLAAAACLFHWQKVDLVMSQFQMDWHAQIIQNSGPYPDQYRILTYYLAHGLILLGVPFALAHELLRFLFTTASLYLFFHYLRHWVRPLSALLGLFMTTTALLLSYQFYGMQPTDPLNLLIFIAAFCAFQTERDRWLVPLVLIGMLNRETALLLPLLYALVRYGQAPLQHWAPRAAIAGALAVGIYVGLRFIYGLKEPYAETSLIHFWWVNLTDWQTWVQVLGFGHMALWIAWRRPARRPRFLQRAALLVPVFLLIHLSVGYLRETRLLLPLLPIMLPLLLLALEERFEAPAASG